MDSLNKITYDIISCAYKVHNELGPGLLESAYEACLLYELKEMNYNVEAQKPLPIIYKDVKLDIGYRIDLIIEGKVLVELKSVSEINDLHIAQILTYMKLSKIKIGLLLNFNVKDMKKGIKRLIL